MKAVYRVVVITLMVCLCASFFVGCGDNVAQPYIGTWSAYKIESDSTSIVFSDFASIVKMELLITFNSDGTYIQHYYTNGIEGEHYPQTGEYKIEKNRIKLVHSDGTEAYGEIVDGELIIDFNGARQHYNRAS